MKRIAMIMMLIVTVILGGCGNGGLDVTNDDYKFDTINSHLTATDNTLAGLQTQINEINVLIANQQEQLDNISNNAEAIAAINARIDELEAEAAECKAQYDALRAEFDALKAQVATDNAAINGRLTDLEGRVSHLKDRLNSLYGWVRDLCGRVSVLEEAMKKVPTANAPLFVSTVVTTDRVEIREGHRTYWQDVRNLGATIVWTASAGGVTATSYDVWAVEVKEDGSLGLPFKLANGTGSEYFWDGHVDGLPVTFDNGSNPPPMLAVVSGGSGGGGCDQVRNPKVFRFAVTAVDANGNESSPSVTADAIKVIPTHKQDENPS